MILDAQLTSRIDGKRKLLNKLRPLPPALVAKLKQQFAIEMTYNSNAIEGNSLTLKETAWVIQDGLTIKGKPLKDHLEAKDHYDALEFLYETIAHNSKQTVSEVFIRSLHKLIVRETERESAGSYRTVNVMITGSSHKPPDATGVSHHMNELIRWIQKNQHMLHPIELATFLHHKLVYIHPFVDGNGRTARLAMNLLLLREGYPLVVVLTNDRRKYYRVLSLADKGTYEPFVRFIAQAVERSLNIYLTTLLPTKQNKERYVPLSVLARQCPYSKEYLNLLARFGKIEAHKEQRVWVATQTAIERYMRQRKRRRTIHRSF